jgi:hypothetical protein
LIAAAAAAAAALANATDTAAAAAAAEWQRRLNLECVTHGRAAHEYASRTQLVLVRGGG